MAPGTDDPKDLGSKKMFNQEKESDKNEGFSGENLPNNYDPSQSKLKTEVDKDEDGNAETVRRARDVDEKDAPSVSQSSKTKDDDGNTVSKSRGTSNEKQDMKTTENRDFNSDTEEGGRKQQPDSESKTSRGNINFGE